MKQIIRYTPFLLLFFYFHNVKAQTLNKRFYNITVKDGLSQSTVFAIQQDEFGFLWLGTHDGLNRYDGYNFKVFKHSKSDSTSISGNIIYALCRTKDNTLWIGTNGDGLNKYNNISEKFMVFKHKENDKNSISGNVIRCIFEDKEENLWIGTDRAGLNKLDKNTGKFVHFIHNETDSTSLLNNKVLSVCTDIHKNIWVATAGGISVLNPQTNKFTNFRFWQGAGEFATIIEDSKGTIWAGSTMSGLYKFDEQTKKFINFWHDEQNPQSISHNSVTKIFEDSKGVFWVGTSNGLDIFDRKNQQFITYKHNSADSKSIIDNNIATITEDNSGIVWFGCYERGVSMFDRNALKFELYQHDPVVKNTFPDKTVRSIFAESETSIWVGYIEGKLVNFNPQTQEYLYYGNKKNELNSNTTSAIFKDSKGTLWIGTWSKGLNKAVFEKNTVPNKLPKIIKFINYKSDKNNPNSISNNSIQKIFEDKKGRLWIGTADGLNVYNPEKDNFTRIFKDKSGNNLLKSNSIQGAIATDKNNNIWVGTWAGLHEITAPNDLKNCKVKVFETNHENKNCISDNRVISLLIDENNVLWAGTFGGGLNRIDLNEKEYKVQTYTVADGLPNNVIYGLLNDKQGNIWMSTNKGIAKFDFKNKKILNFDDTDGLQDNEFFWGASCKSAKGKMFFGGIKGFNAFAPSEVKNNNFIPPIVITQFKLFEKSIKVGNTSLLQKSILHTKEITLNYDQNILSFQFAALHFSVPENNQYRYKLDNFNKSWITTNAKNRIATYTNLDPGNYVFRVKGSNSDGVWNNKGVILKIHVLPPFWKTKWFIAGSILLILSLIFFIYRLKVSQIKHQKDVLENLVKERTAEISFKNTELLAKNETIIAQNEHIKAGIRYAKTIQDAILPFQENLKKQFNLFIFFKPKDIVSGDFYWSATLPATQTLPEYIYLAVVDCTGHGVPGAFMSMIGSRLLNEIVNERKVTSSAKILAELNRGIILSLKQTQSENHDGMDVCLCRFEKMQNGNMKVQFSGAKRPLILVSGTNNEIEIIKGDRNSIGGTQRKIHELTFTNHEIELKKYDMLFLTTDGFADQNNFEREKFGTKKLIEFFKQIANQDLPNQKKRLEEAFNAHKQNTVQRDDITIIGIRA